MLGRGTTGDQPPVEDRSEQEIDAELDVKVGPELPKRDRTAQCFGEARATWFNDRIAPDTGELWIVRSLADEPRQDPLGRGPAQAERVAQERLHLRTGIVGPRRRKVGLER